jgi:hypothetical protein
MTNRVNKAHPRELLDQIVRTQDFELHDIESLARVKEGTWHDFKSAKLFGHVGAARKDSARGVAEDVTAFCNSDGGLLIFGVEDDRTIKADVPADADNWIHSIVNPLVAAGIPNPKVILKHGVLVVACSRSPQLVPLTRDGTTAFFIRVGDGTSRAPEYMVSDFFLGRRAHPRFAKIAANAEWVVGLDAPRPTFNLIVDVMNDSPVWVEDIALCCIGVAQGPRNVPQFAFEGLDVAAAQGDSLASVRMNVLQTSSGSTENLRAIPLPPFESLTAIQRIPLPQNGRQRSGTWHGALCVIPKDRRTQMFQLEVPFVISNVYDQNGHYAPSLARFAVEMRDVWPELVKVAW